MLKQDGDEDADQRQCAGCRIHAPRTPSAYTLISASHGWRLSIRKDREGNRIPEWLCPTCWSAHRKLRGGNSEQPG